jgi:cytochrome c556
MQSLISAIKKLGGQDPEQQQDLQAAAAWLDGACSSTHATEQQQQTTDIM